MMNLGSLNVKNVNQRRPQLQRVVTSDLPGPGSVDVQYGERTPSYPSSDSTNATTLKRWKTPPSRGRSSAISFESSRESTEVPLIEAHRSDMVAFDEEQIRNLEAEASRRQRVEERIEDESAPTPNNDDTPYIRYAIDQLTRDEEGRVSGSQQPSTSATSSDEYPVNRIIADDNRYVPQRPTRAELALVRKHRSTPGPSRLFGFNATRPLSTQPTQDERRPISHHASLDDIEVYIPAQPPPVTRRYPQLKFLPTILRPFSLLTIITLCLLMIAAIMFCAIYSDNHNGLAAWNSGVYGGRYFTFGFLPQIVGAFLFVYVQCILAALTRIMPYLLMSMEDVEERGNALFRKAFPRHMLWPNWDGPILISIANTCLWISVFTIPLLGCLFSVILVDQSWKWTAVQGIAWTLVTIYIMICMGVVLIGAYLFHRTTGLMWDPRSLADLIAMLPRSNSLRDYAGTETMASKQEIKHKLSGKSDRLGYWRTPSPTQDIFYAIGETGTPIRRYTLEGGVAERKVSSPQDMEVNRSVLYNTATRYRYIPWFLRDTFVVLWCVTAFFLLLAMIIISFLPSTSITNGFPPLVRPNPNGSGYSAANFLYSFIPALLGMILYLIFQPIDMAFRKLQPWAELSHPGGATAERSLLVDYPAALPFLCTISAYRNTHYRVAWFSFASTIFILLPVLAGGMFFPLTVASGEVRMLPNLPSFCICLVILIVYFLTLLLLIPERRKYHLPHSVDCIAEVISFVHSSHILDDAAFRAPRSKTDLVTRLMSVSEHFKGGDARYALGVRNGRRGKESLGVERLGRRGAEDVLAIT